jgi:hypothetical protein
MAEGKSGQEDHHSSQQAIEEIEGPHCRHAD